MIIKKVSLLIAISLSAYTQSATPQNLIIKNNAKDCFTLTVTNQLESNKDPVLLNASIDPAQNGQECPCKSALMKYSAYQEIEEDILTLISGNFSILSREKLMLPVAAQGNLIFADHPVILSITCSNP